MSQKVLNKRSVQVVNNGPKLPTPEQLEYGELAINYANGHETLAIKNNQNEIVPFSSDEKIYSDTQNLIQNALEPVLNSIDNITSAMTDDEFVVATALNDLNEKLNSLSGNSDSIIGMISELSGSVIENYALSSTTHQEIEDAKSDVTHLVDEISSSLSSFSSSVITNYATKAEASEYAASALANANDYTDTVSGNIKSHFGKYATSADTYNAINSVDTKITNLGNDVNKLSGSVTNFSASVVSMEERFVDSIESALTVVYKYKGTVNTFDDLPSNAENGYVYNVISAHSTTPPGTNYAWVEDTNNPSNSHWDELGGFVDLSSYALSADVNTEVERLDTKIETSINELSGSIYTTIVDDEYTIAVALAEMQEQLENAGNVSEEQIQYIDEQISDIQSQITDLGNTYATTETVQTIEQNVTSLSSATISGLTSLGESISAFSASIISEIIDDELVISAGFNDINDRLNTLCGNTESISSDVSSLNTSINTMQSSVETIEQNLSSLSGAAITGVTMNGNTVSTSNNVANLGNVITEETQLSTASTGNGNAITSLSVNNHTIAINKGGTFAISSDTHNTISSFSANVKSTIDALSGNIESTLENYLTKEESEENEYVTAYALNDLNDRVDSLNAFKTNVIENYATSADTYNAIMAATGGSDMSNYALSSNVNTLVSTVSGNIANTITAHTSSTNIHVTSSEKNTWNNKQNALSNANVLNGITSTKVSNWDAAATNSHTHSNKTVLDGITAAKTNSWDSVTAKTNNTDFTTHTSDATIHFTTGDVKTQIESYGYTTNVGTVTGVSINSSTKSPSNGLVTLGTVITAETQLSTASTGTGNVITDIAVSNHKITKTKDITIPTWATATTKPSYTASEVGAMATSERSNYLPTGTTLDDVADGTTRKLSNYATQANFTTHTGDTNIHVTTAQTATWNGKQDALSNANVLAGITSAKVSNWDSKVSNVQSDWNATTGLAVILNKPTIPSAPGTLTTTATTSQSTATNEALSGNIALHKVSKTGSYNDLNNKPTIPTVNDNTITLTFNGATVGTFTLNQNSNKTIDIGTIIGLPSYSAANNGQILGVVNGALTWVTPTTIYTGTGTPSASQGNDGDIYLQTS